MRISILILLTLFICGCKVTKSCYKKNKLNTYTEYYVKEGWKKKFEKVDKEMVINKRVQPKF